MKTLRELINREDPGWPLVQQWIAEATNPIEVLPPPDDARRAESLLATQVTTRSPMGAIIYECGGILVDHGWLRILGSGHPRLPRSVASWNLGRSCLVAGERPLFLLIADDIIGGFFAVDGGGLGMAHGEVCYHSPDALRWESTRKSYSDFIVWCLRGDLAKYYETMRWSGWQVEASSIGGDQAFSIYPFLSCVGPPISERSRKPVNLAEIYEMHVGSGA